MTDLALLVHDLEAEFQSVVTALRFDDGGDVLARPTRAEGWSIREQVTHLAYFDDVATRVLVDAASFERDVDRSPAAIKLLLDDHLSRGSDFSVTDLVAWWRTANTALRDAAAGRDPMDRVPWYGPSMSVASLLTARIMETWAHGVDIREALGVGTPPSERLRHVAHIGVATYGHSFVTRGLDPPPTPVRVDLHGPGGEVWSWGPDDAADWVTGDALEFCLVVTQRRHVADTSLVTAGLYAPMWLTIAQAFAGPPGRGRKPERA